MCKLHSLSRKANSHRVSVTGTVYLRLQDDDGGTAHEVIVSPCELPELLQVIAQAIEAQQKYE